MIKLLTWLEGKRTIISAIATAVWGALYEQKVIDSQMFQAGVVVGACLMAIFIRLALNKKDLIKK